MAQRVVVQLVDDLDGTQSADISTVTFGLDGAVYEIDLTEANASNLRKSLDDYVLHARRTSGRVRHGTSKPGRSRSAATSPERAQAIRDWARRNGHQVGDRGRIPTNIIEAFEAAHAEASSTSRKQKTVGSSS